MTDERHEVSAGDPEDAMLRPAADAFRAALSEHAEISFAPLDPDALRLLAAARASEEPRVSAVGHAGESSEVGEPAVPRPPLPPAPPMRRVTSGWKFALAAAVAVVLAIPVIGVFTMRTGSSSAPDSQVAAASPAQANEDAGKSTSAAAGEDAGASAEVPASVAAELGDPHEGYRWVILGDAAVQVPQSWDLITQVDPGWCRGAGSLPEEPYVATLPVSNSGAACPTPNKAQQVPHVQWRDAEPGETGGQRIVNGWVYTSKVIGTTMLTVVREPAAKDTVMPTARLAP